MTGAMVYKFKPGTHVPAGASAAGIIKERTKIEKRCGAATIDASAQEVLEHPDDYPNLRAFCPSSDEEAMLIAVKDGIRKAYKSVAFERVSEHRGQRREVFVRALHGIRGDSGDREYRELEDIRQNPKHLKELVSDLRREADSYAGKMRNVLAEIEDAL